MSHGGRSTTLIPFGRSDSPRHPGFPRRDDAGLRYAKNLLRRARDRIFCFLACFIVSCY
nr:MAG TPA_asm: hypothetical protein [Caudoviricetes sp.]